MKRTIGFILALVCIVCCMEAKETTIVIYSTNDMHGSIHNFAKIASFIKQERCKHPNVILMSGGDMFTGNPVVDRHKQPGLPMIELMNKVGYQYAVFGNHEFDYGQEVLAQRQTEANFQFLCANMHVDGQTARIPQPEPFTIIKMDGIRIAVLGLVEASKKHNGEWYPATHPMRLQGITFTDPSETALEYRSLRQECDLFIGLFHTGYDKDLQIAQAMPELDVIIGGHSHTKVKSTRIKNGVLITQAQDCLKCIGKTTITLKDKKILNKTFELINVDELREEDPEVTQMIKRYTDESPLNKVLAKATAQFNGMHPLGALMTDAMTHIYETDFAFQNSGGIRIGMLPKGNITSADVYRLDPFDNAVMVYEMKPADIRTLILNSYRNRSQSIDLIPSGLKYTIHTHEGKAVRVTLTLMDGKLLDEDKAYRVGMNSYIASSYTFNNRLPHKEMGTKATEALIEYLKLQKEVTPSPVPRGIIMEEQNINY